MKKNIGIIVLICVVTLLNLGYTCSKTSNIKDIVGHKILLDYGANQFVHTYFSENKMKWEAIKGEEKGLSAVEEYKKIKIADSVYLISWIEKNGTVVAITMNLDSLTANAVAAFPDNGTNKIWRLSGKIKIME